MNLEELRKEYETQDNRGTAYPFYVVVQQLEFVGRIESGESVCGDGKTKTEYIYNGDGDYDNYDSIKDLLEDKVDFLEEDIEDLRDSIYEVLKNTEKINSGYLWMDKEIFLTIKGAEEYMELNKHNLGKSRTCVKYFESRNFEMRGLLKEIGFRVE